MTPIPSWNRLKSRLNPRDTSLQQLPQVPELPISSKEFNHTTNMTDHDHTHNHDSSGNNLASLLSGVIIGAALTYLLTSKNGQKLLKEATKALEDIGENLEESKEELAQKVEETVEKGKEAAEQKIELGKKEVERKFEQTKKAIEDKVEDVKAQIKQDLNPSPDQNQQELRPVPPPAQQQKKSRFFFRHR